MRVVTLLKEATLTKRWYKGLFKMKYNTYSYISMNKIGTKEEEEDGKEEDWMGDLTTKSLLGQILADYS